MDKGNSQWDKDGLCVSPDCSDVGPSLQGNRLVLIELSKEQINS